MLVGLSEKDLPVPVCMQDLSLVYSTSTVQLKMDKMPEKFEAGQDNVWVLASMDIFKDLKKSDRLYWA